MPTESRAMAGSAAAEDRPNGLMRGAKLTHGGARYSADRMIVR